MMSNEIFIVSLVFLGISFLVSAILKSKFTKYSKIGLANGLSGREIAEKMLQENGIYDVKVTSVEGFLSAFRLLQLPPMNAAMLFSMPLNMAHLCSGASWCRPFK